MTPEKRATLTKLVIFVVVTALLVAGYITQEAWLTVVMGT